MKIWKALVTLALAGGLAAAACTSTKPSYPSPIRLDGTNWQLTTLGDQPVLAERPVTLNFESGTINGTDGCNSYRASYTVDGNKFTAGKDLSATLLACPEPIMRQAAAYTAALKQAVTYRIDGSQLELRTADGALAATFKKAQ